MKTIASINPRFAGHVVGLVDAPVAAPKSNVIYRIKKPDGPRNGKGNRQNAYVTRYGAFKGAADVFGESALEGTDFTIYRDALGWGFLPPGGVAPDPAPVVVEAAPDLLSPLEATPSQRRDAFNELSSVIDADTGRYTGGWTDEQVAEVTGLPVSLIAGVRVSFYGEPKPELSPEDRDAMAAMKAEVDAVVSAHRKLADVAEGLSHRIELALKGR